MEVFLGIVGSFASIIGIPLAIYLYIRSEENRIYKIKKSIIDTLSTQIGESRFLSRFEITSVIKSKLRDNNMDSKKISPTEIIEDLVSAVTNTPFLSKKSKQESISNLKTIFEESVEGTDLESSNHESILSKSEGKLPFSLAFLLLATIMNIILLSIVIKLYNRYFDFTGNYSILFVLVIVFTTLITVFLSFMVLSFISRLTSKLNSHKSR